MRILFYPYDCEKNKYIEIIQNCIRELGVEIKPLNFKKIKTVFKKADAVYLNWFENISLNPFKASIQIILKKMLIYFYKIRSMKVIFVMHNKTNHDKQNRNKSKKFLKWILNKADKVIIVSKGSKDIINKICKKNIDNKIYLVPHPNYINIYNNNNKYTRDQFEIKKDEFVFLFVGLIRPYKNVELIIENFKKLEYKNKKLIIAGLPESDEYKIKLLKLIKNDSNIKTIFSFIPDNDITSLISICDVMVFPLNIESSLNSGSVFLCASNKKTFICPEIEGIKDFKNKEAFISYNYSNDEEHSIKLYNAMLKIIDEYNKNPENIKNMGKMMYEMMKQDYSKEKIKLALKECLYNE